MTNLGYSWSKTELLIQTCIWNTV